MAFFGAGRLNGIAKRSQGSDIFVVTTDRSLNASQSSKQISVFTSLPGTNQLVNQAGPQPQQPLSPVTGATPRLRVSPSGTYLATPVSEYPFIIIYKKTNGVYKALPIPSGTLPSGIANCVCWSPDESKLIVGLNVSPYLICYSRSGDTFTSTGTFSVTPTGGVTEVKFDPTGLYLAASHAITPFVSIYSVSGTTFTKIANPATLPTGSGYCLDWSPNDLFLAIGHNQPPNFTMYYYSGSGTGTTFTKLGNPNTSLNNVTGISFNNTLTGSISTASIATMGGSGVIITMNLGLNGTNTTFLNSTTVFIGGGAGGEIKWSPNSTSLISAGSTSPIVAAFNRVGNSYSTITNFITTSQLTAEIGSLAGLSVDWNTSTNNITLAYEGPPFISEFSKSGNTSTNVDCWGRTAAGYSLNSFPPLVYSNSYVVSRFNTGGSNTPGSILITTPAGTNIAAFYYDSNANTYQAINTSFTATSVGTIADIGWSPNGNILTVYGASTPYINNYYVSGIGTLTTFTKLSQPIDPYTFPTPAGGNSGEIAWSPDNSTLVIGGSNTSPYMVAYNITGTGIGTTFTRLTSTQFLTLPSGAVPGCAFSPDGTVLAVAGNITYPLYNVTYNGTLTTFSTASITVSPAPALATNRVTWSKDSSYVSFSSNNASTRALRVYKRTSNTYTGVAPTITNPSTGVSASAWTNDVSSLFYFVEQTSGMTSGVWPGTYYITRQNTTSTFLYTTSTTSTIDTPVTSYYSIDWRADL